MSELARRTIAEAEKIPEELRAIVAGIEDRDLTREALRRLTPEQIEDLTAELTSTLAQLRQKADTMAEELRRWRPPSPRQ